MFRIILAKILTKAGAVIAATFFLLVRAAGFLLKPFAWFAALAAVVLLVLLFIVPTTPRDVAYRNIDPNSEVCGLRGDGEGWSVLAEPSVDNSETKAIATSSGGDWKRKFSCALQRHEIPGANGGSPLVYNLAFLEFREDGSPYELIKDLDTPYTPEELSSRVRYVDADQRKPITQLRALTNLLRQTSGRNYVIVFVHGWRHDARLGDDNVGDLRRYAAHAARFLQERCRAGETEQCDRVVTAVYVGWRGARIDETAITADWGKGAAALVAALTLFDRKPVSEAIAPHVLTALRSIESTFGMEKDGKPLPYYDRLHNPNRLLIIGHSLGGNLLATALQHDLVKRVEWQARRNDDNVEQSSRAAAASPAGTAKSAPQPVYFDPPLGNLVVLINPASEARKWTSIQRAVWEKIAFREGEGKTEEILQGHRFFPDYQRPVLVAVTSAFAWPPGGIRAEDCAIAFNFDKEFLDDPPATKGADRTRRIEKALHDAIEEVDEKSRKGGVVYDTATHDLFPFFKFDFRPMADRIDRYGRFLAGQRVPKLSCKRDGDITAWWPWLIVKAAEQLRDAPFQESNMEETRTIGNLDVPRHAAGSLENYLLTAKPFGTTHEIRGLSNAGATMSYSELATSSRVACPISDFWLSRARRNNPPYGMNWNSRQLAPAVSGENPNAKPLSASISHGFELAGMQPITRANDPFWNMRAYDDVVAEHSGFRLSSFICAINQLVMDEPTKLPDLPKPAPPPGAPKNAPENLVEAATPVAAKN